MYCTNCFQIEQRLILSPTCQNKEFGDKAYYFLYRMTVVSNFSIFGNSMLLFNVLEIPFDSIKSVRVVSPYLWKHLHRQKPGILDMAMEMQDGTKVNVEMQVRRQEYWIKRQLSDLLEVHTIELNKPLRGACAVNDWIRLFNAKQEEDLDMIKVKNRGMKEAIEIPKNLSLRKTLRYLREERLKAIRDRKERTRCICGSKLPHSYLSS